MGIFFANIADLARLILELGKQVGELALDGMETLQFDLELKILLLNLRVS